MNGITLPDVAIGLEHKMDEGMQNEIYRVFFNTIKDDEEYLKECTPVINSALKGYLREKALFGVTSDGERWFDEDSFEILYANWIFKYNTIRVWNWYSIDRQFRPAEDPVIAMVERMKIYFNRRNFSL